MRNPLLILLFILSTNLSAMNFFGMSAESWNKIDKIAKLTYMMGLFDGLVFAEYKIHGTTLNTKVEITQYIEGITSLYEDYRNRNIPVAFLIRVVSLEINGASKDEVKFYLQQYRKRFAPK